MTAIPQHCDHCGLPVPGAMVAPSDAVVSGETPSPFDKSLSIYCCVGCQHAAAIQREAASDSGTQWTLTKLGISIFFAMNVMAFTMALWTFDVYDDASRVSESSQALAGLFRYICLFFSVPVLFLLGGPLLSSCMQRLRAGIFSTDLLLLLGIAASYVYSIVSLWHERGHLYFEVGVMVLVAVTLGRWLEATGKVKTTAALRGLAKLLPEEVCILDPTDNQEHNVPRDEAKVGQHVRVLHGQRIPFDGEIIRGEAEVDEQVITGESQPVEKHVGDQVFAGTMNLDGDLVLRLTVEPDEGVLKRLMDAVTTAAAKKSDEQLLADRVANWFVPLVFASVLLTLLWHGMAGDWNAAAWSTAIFAALSIVVIACPCALGIATPLAVWAGLGRASQAQVLFRDGSAVSKLARVNAICFDKTGTLTTGHPELADFIPSNSTSRPEILYVAASICGSSTHRLAGAIKKYAANESNGTCAENVQTIPGKGVTAEVDGLTVCLGSPRLMNELALEFSEQLSTTVRETRKAGQPLACLGWDGEVRGLFIFRESLRPGVADAIRTLQSTGQHIAILTGDYAVNLPQLGDLSNIEIKTELLPEDKLNAIAELKHEHGVVAMIGDGVNDAPALAAADIGIAMGCGADVSRETADVCLLGNNLDRIPWAIDLAQSTVGTIHRNLFWAFSYNTIGIIIAATGNLNPVMAAIAMVGSSLFVITNSLRLANGPVPQSHESPSYLRSNTLPAPTEDVQEVCAANV